PPPPHQHPQDAPARTGMPVPAAGLADVLVRDPHPAVPLRLGDHRLEQAPEVLPPPPPPLELGLGLAKPHRQRIAHALELAGPQHARPADRPDAPLDPLARKRRGEELAEPPLERRDLTAKVVARPALDHRAAI